MCVLNTCSCSLKSAAVFSSELTGAMGWVIGRRRRKDVNTEENGSNKTHTHTLAPAPSQDAFQVRSSEHVPLV